MATDDPTPDVHPHGSICHGTPTIVVLGNQFRTDVALVRFTLAPPVVLEPGSVVSRIVLTTVAQALGAAAAHLQDVEEGDIGAEYRVAMTPGGRSGQEVEIYLYDLTPGGAGFVRTALKDIDGLFASALERLEGCDCTHSCYECLRSYRNKFDHPYLDRHLAAAFLRHCVYGEAPQLDDTIEDRLLRAMVVDLEESGCNVDRVRGGLRLTELENRTVVVGHSLTPGAAGTASGRSLHSEGGVVVDQLLIDRALPAAVLKATGPTTSVDELAVLPAFFKLAEIGLPIYTANSLEDGLEEAGAPLAHVETEGMPDGAFIVRLDSPTLDDLNSALRASGWAVFARPTTVISRSGGRPNYCE